MKKTRKQKIISNIYFNTIFLSMIVTSIHMIHNDSYKSVYASSNISFVNDNDNNNNNEQDLSQPLSIDIDDIMIEPLMIEESIPVLEPVSKYFPSEDIIISNPMENEVILISESVSKYLPSADFTAIEPIIIESDSVLEDIPQYSGMALSHEFEDDLKKLAESYHIPYQILLTIGYRESGGNWNTNGVISSTNDYGQFQINECNLAYLEEKLGCTREEILNDPLKNAEACLYLLNDIIKREDVTTLEDIFGMYNGWVNWENKPLAVEYVDACMEIVDTYFPDFEYQKEEMVR